MSTGFRSPAGTARAAPGPDPFAAPVVQLLTGDDQADTAAAGWSASWGPIWSPATVGVRSAASAVATHPSLVVVGVPVAGSSQFVWTGVRIGSQCNVPVACVPWYLGDVVDVSRIRAGRAVVVVTWPGVAPAVRAEAVRLADATGLPLSEIALDGAHPRPGDAAAALAATEHLASVVVIGVDGSDRDGPGPWVAIHTIAPTVLVPDYRSRTDAP